MSSEPNTKSYGTYAPLDQGSTLPPYSEIDHNGKGAGNTPEPYYHQNQGGSYSQVAEDDFLYGSTVSTCDISIRQAFLFKVYSILSMQLLGTTFFSTLFSKVDFIQIFLFRNVWVVYLSMFLGFINLLVLIWKRHSHPLNFVLLTSFTILESVGIGVTVSFYDNIVVLQALLLTLGIFIILTLFALQTKYDFTSWQPYLATMLGGLILISFIQIFFPFGSTFNFFISLGSALIFSAFILVDSHMIMNRLSPDEYIIASVELYLDVVNLFLAILRLLGDREE